MRIRAAAAEFEIFSFPDGLANSSGTVGRYLMDSVGSDGSGYFPQLEKMPPHNHDGVGGMHLYIPWWKFDRQNDFPRGYHIEFGGGRNMPGVGMFDGLCDDEEGYGASLKSVRDKCTERRSVFAGRGEMIPESGYLLRDRSRASWTNGEFRCCASTSNGPNTNCGKRRTCRKRFGRSWRRRAAHT